MDKETKIDDFIPEKVMVVRRGKELRILAQKGREIYIFLRLPREIDSTRYWERFRVRYRKDRKRSVQILETVNAKRSIGDFMKPVRDLYHRTMMGKKIRLRKEE